MVDLCVTYKYTLPFISSTLVLHVCNCSKKSMFYNSKIANHRLVLVLLETCWLLIFGLILRNSPSCVSCNLADYPLPITWLNSFRVFISFFPLVEWASYLQWSILVLKKLKPLVQVNWKRVLLTLFLILWGSLFLHHRIGGKLQFYLLNLSDMVQLDYQLVAWV